MRKHLFVKRFFLKREAKETIIFVKFVKQIKKSASFQRKNRIIYNRYVRYQLHFIKVYQFIKINETDITKNFIDEIYNTPPRKSYPTKKIVFHHIDEIWSFDLLDFNRLKNNKQ